MSNQQPPMRAADAQRHLLSGQVNPFSFDPKNEADELGFKPGEPWNPQIATENEMIGLKKQYHPVISLRLQVQTLLTDQSEITANVRRKRNGVYGR
ncbi:hypothetical protein [Mucilaginibacter sp. R-33]|uniref:hypothetical protein n=1 Tax=Mucilaginibacter sp. R-33 TaxID=3416711 RepID=UPI003CF95414